MKLTIELEPEDYRQQEVVFLLFDKGLKNNLYLMAVSFLNFPVFIMFVMNIVL